MGIVNGDFLKLLVRKLYIILMSFFMVNINFLYEHCLCTYTTRVFLEYFGPAYVYLTQVFDMHQLRPGIPCYFRSINVNSEQTSLRNWLLQCLSWISLMHMLISLHCCDNRLYICLPNAWIFVGKSYIWMYCCMFSSMMISAQGFLETWLLQNYIRFKFSIMFISLQCSFFWLNGNQPNRLCLIGMMPVRVHLDDFLAKQFIGHGNPFISYFWFLVSGLCCGICSICYCWKGITTVMLLIPNCGILNLGIGLLLMCLKMFSVVFIMLNVLYFHRLI